MVASQLDQSFKLQVDESHIGAGAVFQIDKQGIEQLVSFFSKKFNLYQLNNSMIEKEELALILTLQHYVYLDSGIPSVVITNHNPLTFLNSLQNPNQRLMR